MRIGVIGRAFVFALLAASAPAADRGPAFDCAKAVGEVQQLVCQDDELAALDRSLDGVYKEALARARDDMPRILRAEQRGWIKGRDECWKTRNGSPAFLTASWQATNVRDCVLGSYRIRQSELQAVWRLVPAKGPVSFVCGTSPADEVLATFFETDPPTARVERGDRTVTAWLVPSASGSKYEGRNVELWTKGAQEALVTWDDAQLKCKAR
jgi:uncharacterized protein YecT (DUF1311 family)